MTESDKTENNNEQEGKTKKAIADFLAQKKNSSSSKNSGNNFATGNQKTANTKVGNKNFKRNKI